MNNGILFGDVHSLRDLNLFLSPFTPTPAKPKTNYIDVPGGNGSLDLSEALGEVKYQDREFAFTFHVNPADEMTFDEKATQVSNALNGKACNITLDRDPEYYWKGRLAVDQYLQDKSMKKIVVKATVKPYKLKQSETIASFELAEEEQEIVLKNSRKSVVPTITCSDEDAVILFGDGMYTLGSGTQKVLDINLKEGDNTMIVWGTGTITFAYQEEDL